MHEEKFRKKVYSAEIKEDDFDKPYLTVTAERNCWALWLERDCYYLHLLDYSNKGVNVLIEKAVELGKLPEKELLEMALKP